MKHLLDLLKRAGLTEKESSMYLAILSLGFPRISNLAKEVDIPRTSIYIHINNLVRKGFVKKSKKKGVEHVSAIEPEEIIKQTERDLENMRSALPDFERLINIQAKKPDVGFFDTAEGIQRFYDSLGGVKKNEFIYCAESGDTLNYYFQKFGWDNMRQVQKKLAERNIPVKGILTEDALPIVKQMPPDIVGVIDKRIIFPKLMDKEDLRLFIDFYLLPPNKIFFLMTQENLIIEIQNISLYKSLESIFLYLHARGKPINLSETLKSKD
ncbi:MAG: helix-turn-helix domain-containing protein [Patescibacteria group bacterium]